MNDPVCQCMAVLIANVRSYLPKKDAVESLLNDNNTDVAIFTESWLQPHIADHELLQDGQAYAVHRLDRVGRRGGGILIFVKESVPSYVIKMNCQHEIFCVNISLASKMTVIIACYRAPNCDASFIYELNTVLVHLYSRFPFAYFMLCGDFNFPDINWTNFESDNRQSKDFLEMTLTFNLTQMVNTPTRGANILDLVLVSNPDTVKSVSSVEGLSDHNLVLFNLSIPRPVRQRSIKHIRDYNKANFTKINSELSEFLDYFRRSASLRSVDDNWLLFKNKLTSLVELHVPLVRIRGDLGKPWFSNTLKRLLEKKKASFPRCEAIGNFLKVGKVFYESASIYFCFEAIQKEVLPPRLADHYACQP